MNKFPKVNYIGNKEKLSEWICNLFLNENTIFDAFSGGCSIAYKAKDLGYQVITNDILSINYHLSKSLIENSNEKLNENDVEIIFSGNPEKGFVYKNYSNVYFYPEECMELDLYRKNIEKLKNEYKKSLALSLLRRSMIRKRPYSRFNILWEKVVQLRNEEYSYKHYKRKRAYHNESFKKHFIDNLDSYNDSVFDNKKLNKAFNEDIFKIINSIKADIIYIDPPYPNTMNDYFGFYGFLDEFIHSKKLTQFNNYFKDKNLVENNLDKLFSQLNNFKYCYLSYNNAAYPSKEKIIELLSKYSKSVEIYEKKHNYQITGKKHKRSNQEYLFKATL